MNKRSLLLPGMLVALLAGCGGAPPASPAPTEIGTPSGDPIAATIGPAGGTLRSADGRLTLVVPAGALATDTPIAVQPITNAAHGGVGSAYRLTPDGQTFETPVTLTIAYDEADLVGSAAELLGIAFQDGERTWSWLSSPALDVSARTVSVATTHFTDFSLVRGAQITPASADVRVGETQSLRLSVCYPPAVGEDELQPLGYACAGTDDDLVLPAFVGEWSVNGAVGGSASTGTVAGDATGAIFTAPGTVPTPELVAVSARIDGGRGSALVVANLTIVGAPGYGGTVEFSAVAVGVSEGTATVTWTLRSSHSDEDTYVGTGTMSYVYTLDGCTPVTVTAPLRIAAADESCSQYSCLTVRNATADMPNTYDFMLAHEPVTIDVQCGEDTPTPYVLYDVTPVALATATYCPPAGYPSYTDRATLAGSYACDGNHITSSWSFSAR